jgi:sugar transferase (PEP-CTERM system associated)
MIRIFSIDISIKSILLATVESAAVLVSLLSAIWLRFWNNPAGFEHYTSMPAFGWHALIVVAVFQICFYYNDLYDLVAVRRNADGLLRLVQSLGAACLTLGVLYFLMPSLLIGRGVFFITSLLVVTLVTLTRTVVDATWSITARPQKVLIIGSGELAQQVAAEINKRHDLNLQLEGLMGTASRPDLRNALYLGDTDELNSVVREYQIDRIIVAMEDQRGMLPVRELVRLRVDGVKVEDAQSALASLTGRIWLRTARPSWFVYSDGFRRSRLTEAAKRLLDLAFGLIGFIVSAPIMALVAVLVRLDSPGPVLYRQVRVGLKGKHFEVLKFRSMMADAEAKDGAQWSRHGDPRVTALGRYLRKFRLDELPQFINVIRGDMSFVGPRPERPVFVAQLRAEIPYYDERHSVRPGLTGWAQVQYPYGASVEDAFRKLEYDLFYLKHMSVLFDCAIVFRTVRTVLLAQGGR